MSIDINARALALTALDRTTPLLEEFGTLSETSGDEARRAFRDAFAAGARRLIVTPGTYHLGAIPATEEIRMQTPYQQPSVILPPGFKELDGRGAEFILYDGRGFRASAFETWGHPIRLSYLAQDVAAGARTVVLEAGEGARWSVGDSVLWRFGSLPFDKPETLDWGMAVVTAVNGDALTLDRPLPLDFSIASVSGDAFPSTTGETWYNKALHHWTLFEDMTIANLRGSAWRDTSGDPLDNSWTEEFISIRGGKRIRIENCGSARVSIGFAMQYVTGAVIENCWAEDSAMFPGSHAKGISLGETRDVEIRNFRGKGVKWLVHLEAGAQARVIGGSFENTGKYDGSGSYGSDCTVFSVLGSSQLTVRDFTVTGYGGYSLGATKNGHSQYDGSIHFDGTLLLIHPDEVFALQPSQIGGTLDYRIAGGRELWDFRRPQIWRRRIYLRNGQRQDFRGPRGILSRMRVYASPGLTFGDSGKLISFYVGRETWNGLNYVTSLTAGADVNLNFPGGTVAGPLWTNRDEQVKILLRTEEGTSLDAADAYIDIECEIAIDRLSGAAPWSLDSDARNSGPMAGLREAIFTAFDIPSIPAYGTVYIDFPIAAIGSGDLVQSFDYSGSLGNASIRHIESLAGAARVVFENRTGTAIDPAVSTVRIQWRKSLSNG